MRAGFTLVEVLVAVAVASLLILGVTATTQSTIRTADRQKSDARAEEQRARAIEILREDWRGRLRLAKPIVPANAGTRPLLLSTTADSVLTPGGRGTRLVTYIASEGGLVRKEGAAELLLLPSPVLLEFWDGVVWRPEQTGPCTALRLSLMNPEEIVVVR